MTDSFDPALRLADAISGAHFALVALMEAIHGQGPVSSGRRALLLSLKRLGPMTTPRLAAMRPVSRQYVQRLIDELRSEGLVESTANPAHRRSPLWRLTPAGDAHLDAMLTREGPMLAEFAGLLSAEEAERAAGLLQLIRARALALAERPPKAPVADGVHPR